MSQSLSPILDKGLHFHVGNVRKVGNKCRLKYLISENWRQS